jgi:hypothetical protein
MLKQSTIKESIGSQNLLKLKEKLSSKQISGPDSQNRQLSCQLLDKITNSIKE